MGWNQIKSLFSTPADIADSVHGQLINPHHTVEEWHSDRAGLWQASGFSQVSVEMFGFTLQMLLLFLLSGLLKAASKTRNAAPVSYTPWKMKHEEFTSQTRLLDNSAVLTLVNRLYMKSKTFLCR